METKQKIFSSFYVFCEFKEYPQKFRVRVPEITGGGGRVNPLLSIRCGYQTSQYGKG